MRPHLLLVAASAALGLAASTPPALAETIEVGTGDLRAQIETDPWRLTFVDADGRAVLRESAGRTGSQGTLGFRTLTGWAHATRATAVRREGGALMADLETDDPLGRGLEVRIAPAGEGIVSLEARITGDPGDAATLGLGFDYEHSERLMGLGERPTAVDHRGRVVETYVADGPYQPGLERQGISLFVPGPGFRDRNDATYFPIPWVVSTRGYGVLVDNTETAYHRFGTVRPREWSLEVTDRPAGTGIQRAPDSLRLRVFGGGEPAEVLRRMTAALGRQPRADAPWIFGPWFQPGGSLEQQEAQLRKLQEADAPLSVAQTYLHYLPCGDQRGRREAERERIAAFHRLGLAITTYFNPMICTDYQPVYDEAVARRALTKTGDGSPYEYRYSSSPTNHFTVGQFDFSAEAGRDLYRRLLAEATEDGHDGWMEDFGEYTPLDSLSENGMDGTEMHNLYPVQYHCAAHEFATAGPRPAVRFQRSGFTGSARCAQVVWSGDPTTGWGFDGLESQVKAALSMGLSGISTWGSDIGGFFALGENALTPELLKRWVQFGAVSPVMRTQRNGVALPSKDRPQVEDDDQIANWRRWAKLHNQLYPYLVAADREHSRSGLPIMRHLALAHPGDERASAREDQFLFGPDLLAAPVLRPGQTEREVYLPAGGWVDMWRAVSYDERSGGLRLGRASVTPGEREITIPAPLDELPLLARAGAVLPLLPPDVDTLAGYGEGSGQVRLDERRDRLDLLAFPRGSSSASFLEGERIFSRERRGRWLLMIRGQRTRRYSLQASMTTLRRPIRPCRVTLGRRTLPRRAWRYNRRTGALRVSFRARRATLAVHGRC